MKVLQCKFLARLASSMLVLMGPSPQKAAAPKTPCTGKFDVFQVEEISSDDDFEKIAGLSKGKSVKPSTRSSAGKAAAIVAGSVHLMLMG